MAKEGRLNRFILKSIRSGGRQARCILRG